jgi:hypothetical protein
MSGGTSSPQFDDVVPCPSDSTVYASHSVPRLFRQRLASRYIVLINLVLIAIIIGTLAASFRFGIDRGQEAVLAPNDFGGVIAATCAVLSYEKYHSGRYVCLSAAEQQMRSVGLAYDDATLAGLRKTLPEWLSDGAFLDRALDKVFALPRLQGDGSVTDIGWGIDAGYMDFVEFAFSLFGHKIEALYYAFFLLLLTSTALYCIQFWQKTFALFTALSFHLAFLSYLPVLQGVELYSANNYRLLSLLAVIPLFHVLFAILYGLRPTRGNLLLLTLQAVVVAAAADFRSMAYVAVIALTFCCCFFLLYESLRRKENLRQAVIGCWPLAIVLICVASGIVLQGGSKDWRFAAIGGITGHAVWEPLYYDLQLHPDWSKKYGQQHRGTTGDETTVVAVQSYRERHGLLHGKSDFVNGDEAQGLSHRAYEKYARDVYLEFVRNDPWYFVQLKYYDLLHLLKHPRYAVPRAWSALNRYIVALAILAAGAAFFQIRGKAESLRTLVVSTAAVGLFTILFAGPIWITVPIISSLTDFALLADTFAFMAAFTAIVALAVLLSRYLPLANRIGWRGSISP